MKFVVIILSLSFVGLTVVGCNRNGASPASAPGKGQPSAAGPAYTGPFTAGRQVYETNGCTRCHSVTTAASGDEAGGRKGRMRGPNLAVIGEKRSREWIIEHVRDPKSHNPRSGMPGFAGKINDADLQSLGDYLASLK